MKRDDLELKQIMRKISKRLLLIDDIVHEHLFDFDKPCETFRIKKGIEKATPEMLKEYQLSCCIREKVLNHLR